MKKDEITLHELNEIIQLAFGWCGYHAYNFEKGATLHEMGMNRFYLLSFCGANKK